VRHGEAHAIPAAAIVVGDLLELEPGDVVPADARLVDAPNLLVNESALTGESVPVDKTAEVLDATEGREVAERRNMVLKGTAVSYGRGRAIVTTTGMSTALGRVASLLEAHQAPATPLQVRLADLGRRIALATVAVCALVFTIGLARGEDTSQALLASVSLAVAAIPESLPAVVTISLALGAMRMAQQQAIIRKLPAVETLGSVTVIASDKTGTLTEGRMVVERVWLPGNCEFAVTGSGYEPAGELHAISSDRACDVEVRRFLMAGALCNDAGLIPPDHAGGPWTPAGDPSEAALLALAGKGGIDLAGLRQAFPRLAEEPFDARRKRMTTYHATPEGDVLAVTKGAVEVLGGDTDVHDRADLYAEQGYRVLVIGAGRFASQADAERATAGHLPVCGLVAITDPPRAAVADAIAAARTAGIRTVMITGDHPSTARAIADRLGLLDGGLVVTGTELAGGDPEQLVPRVNDIAVYARTTPEQKLAIVEALKASGHVVAMTGDGVNDAPALRRADIGIAMGLAGTEVAKEAADMVLADDNFATIVAAAREGRRIYDNIRRFVRYGLTGGSAEIWVMLIGPVLGLPLPLLPVQILWVNLLTHGLPGLALGVERADPDGMRRPPRPPDENILGRGLWQHVLAYGALTAAVTLAVAVFEHSRGGPWQTMLLTTLTALQLGNALAVRSETVSTFRLGLTTNRFLIGAVISTIVVQLGVIYWPPLQRLLSTEALGLADLALVAAASVVTFGAIELDKLVRRRHALLG
jgi:Ca2+-transporting ATPase